MGTARCIICWWAAPPRAFSSTPPGQCCSCRVPNVHNRLQLRRSNLNVRSSDKLDGRSALLLTSNLGDWRVTLQLALPTRDKRKLRVDETPQCAAPAICWSGVDGCDGNYRGGGRSAGTYSAYFSGDSSRN